MKGVLAASLELPAEQATTILEGLADFTSNQLSGQTLCMPLCVCVHPISNAVTTAKVTTLVLVD